MKDRFGNVLRIINVLLIIVVVLVACAPATSTPSPNTTVTWPGELVQLPSGYQVYFFESTKIPGYTCAMVINYPDSLSCSHDPRGDK